ncbi:hypothetical protein JL102_04745 [Fulvivirga sp. 2943]|uniref:Uncharacterized protein n=2 Tax=Fulvivirga sediminis TaxID=2803949 RepID=A0A937F332_9BACT|nr:hypothetical protein [Fulvivirga sediminis]MBL3655427.1 hypothetical protein [Fulvivirga sediminis]
MIKYLALPCLMLLTSIIPAAAQCAMCRATVENNVSNGEIGIGAGLNFGILYLFVMPYILISVVGYFWYKRSKANAKAEANKRHVAF